VSVETARRSATVLYAVAATAYIVDRITKTIVESTLADREPLVLIPKVLQLNFTENPGGAFSLFGSAPWLFFIASVIVCSVIVAVSFRPHGTLMAVGLGMVLGGALGNLTDRVVRGPGLSGKVVDFVDFHIWPIFNAADSAIVIGAGLILLASARSGDREPAEAEVGGGGPPAA
jgi:signal peptidase II